MERILEAGAFRYRTELEKKISEKPVIDIKVRIPYSQRTENIVKKVSFLIMQNYAKPRILGMDKIKKLTDKDNGLDLIIKSEYDIIEEDYNDKTDVGSNHLENIEYNQEKLYLLMHKTGRAETSELKINTEVKIENNEFHSLYIIASINGILAQEKSLLVKNIIDYWNKSNLLIINNVIKEESGTNKYVRGSIKSLAVEEHLNELTSEEAYSTLEKYGLLEPLKQLAAKKEFKENFMRMLVKILPVKLIKE